MGTFNYQTSDYITLAFYDGTIKAINNAINQMWEEVRKITVWREAA